MNIEFGGRYRSANGDVWHSPVFGVLRNTWKLTRSSDGAICTFGSDGGYLPDARARMYNDDRFDLFEKIELEVEEPDAAYLAEPTALKSSEGQIDLATVYRMDAETLGLALVVGGKTMTYLINRNGAASLAGRIAEWLAK